MDTMFILDLREDRKDIEKRAKLAGNVIRFFNSHNKYFKLMFKDDDYNRYIGVKHNRKYDSKENMLAGGMTSIEQAMNIHLLLVQSLLSGVPGDVVELGCYDGITAMVLQRTLRDMGSNKRLLVYDSFKGLPETTKEDGPTEWKKGMIRTTRSALVKNFKKHGLKPPVIHPGWFRDTLPTELPERISFAHLDSDLYASIKVSLEHVYPRLSKGAVVVIDDYCDPDVLDVNNLFPGVKKACDEFFKKRPEKVDILLAGCECHGYVRKA